MPPLPPSHPTIAWNAILERCPPGLRDLVHLHAERSWTQAIAAVTHLNQVLDKLFLLLCTQHGGRALLPHSANAMTPFSEAGIWYFERIGCLSHVHAIIHSIQCFPKLLVCPEPCPPPVSRSTVPVTSTPIGSPCLSALRRVNSSKVFNILRIMCAFIEMVCPLPSAPARPPSVLPLTLQSGWCTP